MSAVRRGLGVAKEYARALRATVRLRVGSFDPLPLAVALAVLMLGAVAVYAVRSSDDEAGELPAEAALDGDGARGDRLGTGDEGGAASPGSDGVPASPVGGRSEAPEATPGSRVIAATAGAGRAGGSGTGTGTAGSDEPAGGGAAGTRPTAPGSTSTTGGGPSTSTPDTTAPSTSTTVPAPEPPEDGSGGALGSVLHGLSGLLDSFF